MRNNSNPKLLVGKAEATEKIQDRINIGKELHETQVSYESGFIRLENQTKKWTNYNKTLFHSLFEKSPLPSSHGKSDINITNPVDIWNQKIIKHKQEILYWINDLESVYEQLDIYADLPNSTQQPTDNSPMNNEDKKIFIGHGRSLVWREFKDFLVETLGLEYEEFDRISAAGKSINNHLEEMLDKSCMAFLVMTGEDAQADGSLQARPNVIHEIGKCQEKFGFERAIILLEKGCKKFSNMGDIIYIDFAKGNIKETFGEIVRVLIRESIIRIELCN